MNDNPLATILVMAYEIPIWEAKSVFGNQLLVSVLPAYGDQQSQCPKRTKCALIRHVAKF
jgi:hypothetical protein